MHKKKETKGSRVHFEQNKYKRVFSGFVWGKRSLIPPSKRSPKGRWAWEEHKIARTSIATYNVVPPVATYNMEREYHSHKPLFE